VLLVVSSGTTLVQMAQEAREKLRRANANIVGVVLNRIRRGTDGYYQYYYYGKSEE